jgi:membrane-associated phospholipid phosphatase
MRRRYARVATGDPAVMRDGRTSYPSGHAAETFMAFGLLSVYLMAKLKLFTRQSQVGRIDSGPANQNVGLA